MEINQTIDNLVSIIKLQSFPELIDQETPVPIGRYAPFWKIASEPETTRVSEKISKPGLPPSGKFW